MVLFPGCDVLSESDIHQGFWRKDADEQAEASIADTVGEWRLRRRYIWMEYGPTAEEDGEEAGPNDINCAPTFWRCGPPLVMGQVILHLKRLPRCCWATLQLQILFYEGNDI